MEVVENLALGSSPSGSTNNQISTFNGSPSALGVSDSQWASFKKITPNDLLNQFVNAGENPPQSLICLIELVRLNDEQTEILLPLLWQYILNHRFSDNYDEIVTVGAALRKYIAIMPMDRMGELTILLELETPSTVSIELEIEIAKMIYRNFKVFPPATIEPFPELAEQLWGMVQGYIHPRVLLRKKIPAATSMAIAAILAMRSSLAEQTLLAVKQCPHDWFQSIVNRDINVLCKDWESKNLDACDWLRALQSKIFAQT